MTVITMQIYVKDYVSLVLVESPNENIKLYVYYECKTFNCAQESKLGEKFYLLICVVLSEKCLLAQVEGSMQNKWLCVLLVDAN